MPHSPTWSLQSERAHRDALLERVSRAGHQKPVWLIAPPALASWYKAVIAERFPGASVECLSWLQACQTLEQLLLLPAIQAASTLDLEVALAESLRTLAEQGKLPLGMAQAFLEEPQGLAASLVPSVTQWLEWGPESLPVLRGDTTWQVLVQERLDLLQLLARQAASALHARGLALEPTRWAAIATSLSPAFRSLLPAQIVIDGIDRLDLPRSRAVRELERSGVTVVLPTWLSSLDEHAAVEPALATRIRQVTHHRDTQAEIEAAVRWVREQLQATLRPREIALMVPAGAEYETKLLDALGRVGVPAWAQGKRFLRTMPEWQAFRAYWRLRGGGPNAIDAVALLRAGGHLAAPGMLQRVARLYEELPQTPEALVACLTEDEPEGTPGDTLRMALERLSVKSELPQAYGSFWEDWGAGLPTGFRAACDHGFAAYLAIMGPSATAGGLLASLERTKAPIGLESAGEAEAVAILTAGPYAPLPLKALRILGFTEEAFSARSAPSLLLGPLEVESLRQAGITAPPTSAERAGHATRNVWRMLANAETIALSVPERTPSGSVTRPSAILERLGRSFDPLFDPPLPHAASLSEWEWRRRAARELGHASSVLPGLNRQAAEGKADWLAARLPRALSYRIAPDAVLKLLRVLSPSAAETLLQCSFAYYAKGLLRLDERPPMRSQPLEAALSGTIAHRVLECLLAERPDHELNAGQVSLVLEKVLREDFPAFNEATYRLELDGLRRNLESFVTAYGQLAGDLGVKDGLSEWEFGYRQPVTFPLDGAPRFASLRETLGADSIRIGGYVDRVLLRNGRPIAIDFKSGDVAKYRSQRQQGLGAQVAFYSEAIRQAGLGEPEAFAYLSLRNRAFEGVLAGDADTPLEAKLTARRDLETLEGVRQMISRELTRQLTELVKGSIEPVEEDRALALREVKAHPCTYCPHDLLCRQRKA